MSNLEALKNTLLTFAIVGLIFIVVAAVVLISYYIPLWIVAPIFLFVFCFLMYKFF